MEFIMILFTTWIVFKWDKAFQNVWDRWLYKCISNFLRWIPIIHGWIIPSIWFNIKEISYMRDEAGWRKSISRLLIKWFSLSFLLADKRICSVKFCKGCKGMLQKSLYGISKLGCQQLVYAKIIFMFTKFCAPLYHMWFLY